MTGSCATRMPPSWSSAVCVDWMTGYERCAPARLDSSRRERIEGFLRCAVLAVARGTIYVDPRLVLHLLSLFDVVPACVSPRAQSSLSHRERQVGKRATRGASNRDIAQELAISTRTVKNHISNSLAKLGLANRTQLAVYGVRSGLGSVNDAPWELPAATDREVVDAALIS